MHVPRPVSSDTFVLTPTPPLLTVPPSTVVRPGPTPEPLVLFHTRLGFFVSGSPSTPPSGVTFSVSSIVVVFHSQVSYVSVRLRLGRTLPTLLESLGPVQDLTAYTPPRTVTPS